MGAFELKKVDTKQNPADANTKALDKGTFLGFCNFLFAKYRDNKRTVQF